jgi:hypothetical protein
MGLILACLLLFISSLPLSLAQTQLSLEWQRNSGFDLHGGINGQYTVIAHPAGNTTTHVEFYLDDELKLNDIEAPYSWTFSTESYTEGEHTLRVEAYTITGENTTATDKRSFSGFPYMFIVGVLLFGSIVFAFALLLTWYLIKQKAYAKRKARGTAPAPQYVPQQQYYGPSPQPAAYVPQCKHASAQGAV